MKKTTPKKLALKTETVRVLGANELNQAAGGTSTAITCTQPTAHCTTTAINCTR